MPEHLRKEYWCIMTTVTENMGNSKGRQTVQNKNGNRQMIPEKKKTCIREETES